MTAALRRLASERAELWTHVAAASLVCLTYTATADRLDDPLRVLAFIFLIIVFAAGLRRVPAWWAWAGMSAVLLAGIAARPFDVPNHHFVLTYLALTMALSLSGPLAEASNVQRWNARWLIVAIMGFATLHRVLSPEFTDGSYVGYVIATGGFGRPVLRLCGSCMEIVSTNLELVESLRAQEPDSGLSVTLASPVPGLPVVTRAFTIVIVAVEATVCLLFFAASRGRMAHVALLGFALGLGIIRQEFMFLAVLCALGFLACPRSMIWLRGAYAAGTIGFALGALS